MNAHYAESVDARRVVNAFPGEGKRRTRTKTQFGEIVVNRLR